MGMALQPIDWYLVGLLKQVTVGRSGCKVNAGSVQCYRK